MSVQFAGMVRKSAWRKKSHPALILEASPHNVGVPSGVILLPNHYGKGSLTLGISSHLQKVAIVSNFVN